MALVGELPIRGYTVNPAALVLRGLTTAADIPTDSVHFCQALTCTPGEPVNVGCDIVGIALLAPVARQQAVALGVSAPNAKLYTWAAGTQVSQATYADDLRTAVNPNPLIANNSGTFGPIYMGLGVNYDMLLRTSADVTVWFQPNVMAGGACGIEAPALDSVQLEAMQ